MDKQYVLRKPIKAQFWDDEEDRIVDISIPNQCCNDGSHDETTLLLENFNDLFVEFDEDTIRMSLAEILVGFHRKYSETENTPSGGLDQIARSVKEILALLGGANE